MASADRLIEIFNQAKARPIGAERERFVAEACRDEPALKAQVLELLQAHESAGDFLKHAELAPPPASLLTEKPGDRIGRYKLLQQIGEGGCGVVYMAEQEETVRRRVAVKVIKLGMDTKQVIARFEAERQALALMDHPNIAKVFDAGATDTGRPYFVMELVRGIKITDFCDENKLSTADRLKLFIQVCQAIQHAHQKGIIHRDIKPSNMLVTINDGVPVPKVIDFGIAKATQGRLTDHTLFTAFEQFIGTPAYMSPEQAVLTSLDIDTRSDIYSLGVLLYELLTGRTPFDAKELMAAGLDEMRRTIREQEPPKPSTRLGTMAAEALTTTAKQHHTDAPKLIHLLRGDLDWIVMKSLDKDRARRYETANGLAMDIGRHLRDEPVIARPPSALYRLEKSVRRNKLAFAAGTALGVMLLIGVTVSTLETIRATRAEREQARQRRIAQSKEKKSEQVARFLKDMLKSVDPSVALGRDATMLQEILGDSAERVSKDLKDQPEVAAELLSVIGNTYLALGDLTKAETMQRETLRLRKAVFGETNGFVAVSLYDLANVLNEGNAKSEAEGMHRKALAMRRTLFGEEDPAVADSLTSLADVLLTLDKLDEANSTQREALRIQRKLFHEARPELVTSLENLGQILWRWGKLDEAEAVEREALAMSRALWGNKNPEVATLLGRLGFVFLEKGNLAEAEKVCAEAVEMRRQLLGNGHYLSAIALRNLAGVLWREGKLAEAEPLAREDLSISEKKVPDKCETFCSRSFLGGILLGQKKYAEAEPFLLTGYEGMKQREAQRPVLIKQRLAEGAKRLVQLYEATDRPEQAAQWKKKLAEFDEAEAEKKTVSPKP
jgi:serine/threonine protein kinase